MAPLRATWKCGNALSIMEGGHCPFCCQGYGMVGGKASPQPTVCISVCLCLAPPSGLPENHEGTMVMLSLS